MTTSFACRFRELLLCDRSKASVWSSKWERGDGFWGLGGDLGRGRLGHIRLGLELCVVSFWFFNLVQFAFFFINNDKPLRNPNKMQTQLNFIKSTFDLPSRRKEIKPNP